MVASVRIARFVSETLGIPVCWDASIADQRLKTLLIVNGAFAFAGNTLLAALGKAICEAERVIWIQNDYTIVPPKVVSMAQSPFRKAFVDRHLEQKSPLDYWTTVRRMSVPGVTSDFHHIGAGSKYLNWNALTYVPIEPIPFHARVMKDWMIYYGSFRKQRQDAFDRYFNGSPVNIAISSPSKKFQDNYKALGILHDDKAVDLHGYLAEFGMGLYIEDKKSHEEFHSPANRFYEMLSVGLPIVFQPESESMLREAGYDIRAWVVGNREHFIDTFNNREQIATYQIGQYRPKAQLDRKMLEQNLVEYWNDYQLKRN